MDGKLFVVPYVTEAVKVSHSNSENVEMLKLVFFSTLMYLVIMYEQYFQHDMVHRASRLIEVTYSRFTSINVPYVTVMFC